MVVLIDKALDWWNKTMARLGCKMYGHVGTHTIEIYSRGLLIKNYRSVSGKIIFVEPYKSTVVTGKHRCGACGATFIGNIVKEEICNDKPHGTP